MTAVTSMDGHGPPRPDPVAIGERDRRIRDVLPAMVRQVPVGVGVIRRDRTIAYHNDELGRILRLGRATGTQRLESLRRPDGAPYRAGDEPVDRLFESGRPTAHERAILPRTDGPPAEVSLTMTPIIEGSGAVLGAIVYVEDLTAHLEDASLREAFVGVLSHELRTPITSIYGGTQLLLDDRVPSDVRAAIISDIAAEAEQLHRLVEDLLAIARVERGVTDVGADPVLLQRLATQAARAEERRWPGRTVEVQSAPGLPAVKADDGYTTQVLRNLISNAVKYSPPDQPVVVTLDADETAVNVAVLDRGRGFPPGIGTDAFRLFYRSPAVAARVPGTGIGLYVARALVEAQGGRIWLRNRPEGGAEVGFSLPLYRVDDGD